MGIGVFAKSHHSKIISLTIISLMISFIILINFSCSKKNIPNKVDSIIYEFECYTYPSAHNIVISTENPPGTKAISYILNIEYPAKEVIKFYDDKFIPPKWFPFSEDGFGDRKWFKYVDATKPGEPEVNRFVASWIDPNKQVRLILTLIYLSTAKKDELGVTCQIYPFFDLRTVEKEYK